MMHALREGVSRLTARLFFGQWVGIFVLLLLAAGWLQIPDSHTWQFAVSMLSAVLLVIIFLWLYTATFRHLRPCAIRPPWWLSCLRVFIRGSLWCRGLSRCGSAKLHSARNPWRHSQTR